LTASAPDHHGPPLEHPAAKLSDLSPATILLRI
jgi:hypothetical protein